MENVVELRNYNTYEHISDFIQGLETENTRNTYAKAIEDFFKWRVIPMETLNSNHLNELDYSIMKKFRTYLRRKLSCNTVNTRMNALYSMLKELSKIKENGQYIYTYRYDDLKLKPLKAIDAEDYGYVEWDEVTNWINYLLHSDQNNREGKAAMFHIGRLTGIRKEGLSQLNYTDLIKEDGVWTLRSDLKGNKYKFSLRNEDAQLLLDLKKTDDPKEKIFKMSVKTIERTFKHIVEVFEIPPERNIALHSLRGLAIYEAYLASGKDILAAQRIANHESIETTYGYIKRRNDIHDQPTLYMGKEFNAIEIESVSHEDLKQACNKLSRAAQYELQKVLGMQS